MKRKRPLDELDLVHTFFSAIVALVVIPAIVIIVHVIVN
jgi:hypothetical protein